MIFFFGFEVRKSPLSLRLQSLFLSLLTLDHDILVRAISVFLIPFSFPPCPEKFQTVVPLFCSECRFLNMRRR